MDEADMLEFFNQVRDKLNEIRHIADTYGLGDDFAYVTVAGVYVEDDGGTYSLKAMTDFFIGDQDELDRLLAIGSEVYQDTVRISEDNDNKLESLLGDLGLTTPEDESE